MASRAHLLFALCLGLLNFVLLWSVCSCGNVFSSKTKRPIRIGDISLAGREFGLPKKYDYENQPPIRMQDISFVGREYPWARDNKWRLLQQQNRERVFQGELPNPWTVSHTTSQGLATKKPANRRQRKRHY